MKNLFTITAAGVTLFFLIFKTKLVSSTLRTVAVKLVYSPTRFV